MVSKIRDLELIVTDTEVEALILETTLIQKFKPRYNIDLKDDKSYPYIVVTNEPYPRVFPTRRVIRDGSRYFGPYTDVKSMYSSLKMIREMYKVRSCNYFIDQSVIEKRKIKICFDFHIKKCEGPCEGLVSQAHYQSMIGEVVQILRGKTSSLVRMLEERMDTASEALRFEEAGEARDKIRQLRVYTDRQKVVDAELVDRDLVSVAVEGDDASGVIFKVREGKIVGRQHFYMSGVEGKEEGEIVEQLVERYYLIAEEVPPEIFLPVEIEGKQAVEEWLSAKLAASVSVVVPKIGDKAKLMAMCKRNAQFLLGLLKIQKEKNKDFMPHSIRALQRDLRLPRPPRKIECFDISNTSGTDSVASMVVFLDGRPRKSEYRKFKIKTVDGPNDFASMQEVVRRRYERVLEEHTDLPDLIVVDGGKGQLSSAIEVLDSLGLRRNESGANEHIAQPDQAKSSHSSGLSIIGLAKRLEEVFVPGASEPQSIPKTSSGLKLLQQIRDEAHRFAITYHRSVRAKRVLQSELDLIAGVGKKRAKALLEVLGSVQAVKFATLEQLSEVVGEKTALRIREYFGQKSET